MQILTPDGFRPFDGVARYWHESGIKFIFDDGTELSTAIDHRFIVNKNEMFAKDVKVGDYIGKRVREIKSAGEQFFYDPVNVSKNKIYCHDKDLVSHNTFFGTGDTLINAETLMSLRAKEPLRSLENGQLSIYSEPVDKHDYIMTVDVSKGRGQDYSTFTIIDISTVPFQQVAAYRNNTISPILFPNVIYKYANLYNKAYVVIENNDEGSLTCYGLHQELEYENMHVTSSVKTNSLGVMMNKKTKKIGCSGAKDFLEEGKLEVHDAQTISEISTFERKGQSFEASDGNHDDLMMNLVMFGYFATTSEFQQISDIDIKKVLFEQKERIIDEDVPPFGFIDNNEDLIEQYENVDEFGNQREEWQIVESPYEEYYKPTDIW